MNSFKEKFIAAFEKQCYRMPGGRVRWHDTALPDKASNAIRALANDCGNETVSLSIKEETTSSGTPGNVANSVYAWKMTVVLKNNPRHPLYLIGRWVQIGGSSIKINGTPLCAAKETPFGYTLQCDPSGLATLEQKILSL